MVTVRTHVKEYVRSKDLMSSEDFLLNLEKEVKLLIDRASQRAVANGRKTIKGCDL